MRVRKPSRGFVITTGLGLVLLGVTVWAAGTNILAVGTIPHSGLFDGPATVTVRTLTIGKGEVLQWHYHPGYAFNVVKSGTLTVEDGCGGAEETLHMGDAFEELEGHVHRAKNLSTTEDVVVYNTFIMPQGRPTTVNLPERRCGPPSEVEECKDDGWAKFTHPHSFANQGECVQYVRHRPRLVLPVPEDPQP
ncbi:MAG TPA: cupin domain-containing protein [Pyrinomonadaceae bacterium]|jgi:quercetin dioxygenase-like cupin family protein|nr:cupin domain-containing protein [Pyrinomonadaceae bacterium]